MRARVCARACAWELACAHEWLRTRRPVCAAADTGERADAEVTPPNTPLGHHVYWDWPAAITALPNPKLLHECHAAVRPLVDPAGAERHSVCARPPECSRSVRPGLAWRARLGRPTCTRGAAQAAAHHRLRRCGRFPLQFQRCGRTGAAMRPKLPELFIPSPRSARAAEPPLRARHWPVSHTARYPAARYPT